MHSLSKSLILLILLANIFPIKLYAEDAEKDLGNLGEIRYSILSEPEFQRLYGVEWIPLDGRVLPHDSDLRREFNWNQIPAGREVFLRIKDYGRNRIDGNGNIDGDLGIGAYQADAFQGHGH